MTEWISDTMLFTTILLAAVMILRKPAARLFGPTIAYGLWLLPAARAVMPSLEHKVVIAAETAPVIPSNLSLAALPANAKLPEITAMPMIDWTQLLISVWLGIAALIFIVQMLRYVSMREALLADAGNLGRVGGVHLVESDQVSGPLAFGLLRRYIAVPLNFNAVFPPAEREMALAHEMAHHRSGDLFANLAGFSLLCLTWFNPLSWFAWRAFRFDQEAACDARVVAGCSGEAKLIYGRALARAAHDGLPTFATALNHRSTIVARLRNLTMTDISKTRRLSGRLGIAAMIAVILPMTATIVPVWAQSADTAQSVSPQPGQARTTQIDIKRSGNTPYVITVIRDGKKIVMHSDTKLSDDQINTLADRAEAERANADNAAASADNAAAVADNAAAIADSAAAANDGDAAIISVRTDNGRNTAHAVAAANGAFSYAVQDDDGSDDSGDMVPDIEISESSADCSDSEPVTTNVTGHDGKGRSSVRMVICGKTIAQQARLAALEGLRDAADDIRNEEDMPASVQRKVLRQLERQIERLERQMGAAG
jgi:bla regulator protein blaR1